MVIGDEAWQFFGDSDQQGIDPSAVGLGEVLQHVVVHQILVAGVADAEAHPPVVAPDMGIDRAQAVVPAVATTTLDPHLAGGEVEVIVQDDDLVEVELVVSSNLAQSTAGVVHVGLRLETKHLARAHPAFGDIALQAPAPRTEAVTARDLLHRHEADVVPIALIARTGIAETGE